MVSKSLIFWIILLMLGFGALLEHRRLRRFNPGHQEIKYAARLDLNQKSDTMYL